MLGSIVGDIVGSPYEKSFRNIKTEKFPLFDARSRFTDDTVMTVAIAEGIMGGYGNPESMKEALIDAIHKYGHIFPYAGYGQRFFVWLRKKSREPYNSYGNGSAMRVSPVAWAYDSLETVIRYAQISAEVTHNHPEGIKGACAIATGIFMARTNASREEIKSFICNQYGYNLSRTLEDLRQGYIHDESCQNSVPQAITAFLASSNFEDALRKAVSLGGDSDTIAAMTGSIAEAFYGGIPPSITSEVIARLDPRLVDVIKKWQHWLVSMRVEF